MTNERLTRLLLFLPLLVLIGCPAKGQVSNPTITVVTTAPSGSCTAGLPLQLVGASGVLYSCQSGTWASTSGSGSFVAGGDLSGTASSQEVVGLLSHSLPSLTTGYLNWTGSAWALTTNTSGFPITIGSTSIASGSTTTAITGLTLDGVTPTTFGYLDATSSIQTQLNGKQSTFGSQTANYFFAAPNGSAGTPSFRAIVAADIPTLNQSTTGNAATATALAATPSQCSGGQFATGIAASGNANCGTPSGSGTVNSGTQYSPAYYAATGTAVSGITPFTGLGYWSTTAAPSAATSTEIQTAIGSSIYAPYAGDSSIATVGTLTAGTWHATAIANTYGGTGISTASSTGVPQISSGTWSVSTTLPSGLSATNLTLTTPALGTPTSGVITSLTGTCTSCNVGGTAANLSGTPALPNGTTATTQTTGDNTTKLATDAFVLANQGSGSLPTASFAGQVPVSSSNSSTYTASSPSVPVTSVTSSGTTLSLCATTSSAGSRGSLHVLNLSGTDTVVIPDPSGSGCGAGTPLGFAVQAGTWTISDSGSGEFYVITGSSISSLSSTFVMTPGNYASLTTDGTNWYVRINSAVPDATVTVGTTAISANTCTSASTVTMTGLTTAMTASFTPTTDVSSTTGWSPASTGQLYFSAWPSAANTLSYKVCNGTSASITPGASTTWNVSAK